MTLSVLSALARLGMDPWQEAGRLAKLPRTAAVEGLARTIAAMPASVWPLPDATAIAARLVALLPKSGAPSMVPSARPVHAATLATTVTARLAALLPTRGGRSAQPAPATSRAGKRWVVVLALLGIALAGLMLNLGGHREAASRNVGAAHWLASQPASASTSPVGQAPAGEMPQG